MNSTKFLLLAFDHIGFLLALSIILVLLLYRMTSRIAGGVSDPFHFYYAFTFGTSYAVVGLLAFLGYIGLPEIALIVGYGLIFLLCYRLFSRLSFPPVQRAIRLWKGGVTFFRLALLLYILAALIYVSLAGFAFLSESRFETNRGVGFLVRIMDPLRLFIVGYVAIIVAGYRGRRTALLWCGLGLFALASSLLNGSKFALLESAYVAAVAVAVRSGRKALPLKKVFWPALLVLLLATGYALTQLFFNFKADASPAANTTQYISGTPLLLEQFAVRIVSNGDMYYLGLPSEVLHSIRVDHPLVQLFGPIIGGGAISSLFGYDVNNTDVGRQIILYWDPFYPVSGGPTNHFDLTAYVYFGPILGTLFVMILALILAQINRLKQHRYSTVGCAAVAALYCRSLAILLNPATGLALISDILVVFSLLSVLAWILNGVRASCARGYLASAGGQE
jgi:hypothetical protein